MRRHEAPSPRSIPAPPRRSGLVIGVLALCACQPSGTKTIPIEGDPTVPPVTDTGTPDTDTTDPPDTGTTDTGTTDTYPQPTSLEIVCAPTNNALRFGCTVTVEPAQPVAVRFMREDGLSVERTHASEGALGTHNLPLYFLAPNQRYDVTAYATTWPDEQAATQVTAGTPPSDLALTLSMTGTSTMGLIGSHNPCNGDAEGVIYDTNTGDLVWHHTLDNNGTLGVLDMIQFTEDGTILGESDGDLVEVDLLGQQIMRLDDLDDAMNAEGCCGFHHDVFKRNGVYYLMYQQEYGGGGWTPDVLDVVVIVDAAGTELGRWFPDEHLQLPANWSGDYLHTNTIYVDEAGDIYLSWLTQETIGKIEGDWTSPDFGTPLWILRGRDTGEIGNTIATDWSMIGGNDYFNFQHSLMLRPDGRLQLLDNTNGRGLVISLDEVNNTATVDGAYDTRESSCGAQGTSRSTQAGNPVVGCLGDWVREYDGVTGAPLWEAEVQCPGGGGGWGFGGAARWYPLDGW